MVKYNKRILLRSNEVREEDSPIAAARVKFSKAGLFSGFMESALVGLSFLTAFLAQKVYLDFRSDRILFGHGELMKMSMGIAFCYGFIFVLRRCYQNRHDIFTIETIKNIFRLTLESYLLYLAMLFLIKDYNFMSAKLAVGISFSMSVCFISFYRIALAGILARKEIPSGHRKITLKKSPVPAGTDELPLGRKRDIESQIALSRNPSESASPAGKVFIINSSEDIKRLELIGNIKELQVKIGNLSVSRIPEAVKVARKRGLGIEIAPPLD